jgi:hypothetical protein
MATSAGAVAAAAVARARREIRDHFEAAEAFDAAHAVSYEPPNRMHARQFDLLVGRGILRGTGDGRRYWLDRDEEQREEQRRRAAALLLFKILLIAVVLAIAAFAILSAMG